MDVSYFSYYLCLGCFQIWDIRTNASVNISLQPSWGHTFVFLLSRYLKMGSLSQMISVFNFLRNQQISKTIIQVMWLFE